jgi:hypothetical protein
MTFNASIAPISYYRKRANAGLEMNQGFRRAPLSN